MTEQLTETTEAEPKAKPTKKGTDYMVLYHGGGGAWSTAGTQVAASPKAAISAYLETLEEKAGTYVAVPVRNWRPITVGVETQTKLKFS